MQSGLYGKSASSTPGVFLGREGGGWPFQCSFIAYSVGPCHSPLWVGWEFAEVSGAARGRELIGTETKKPLKSGLYAQRLFLKNGGEGGIRTPGTLLTYTRFPGVHLQPARSPLRIFNMAICAKQEKVSSRFCPACQQKIWKNLPQGK